MRKAISNTSPLLYLHRIGALDWLPRLFDAFWAPSAVIAELQEGRRRGFDVPDPASLPWVQVAEPQVIPAEWRTLELGRGELAAMALARENPGRIILLDDALCAGRLERQGFRSGNTEDHAGGESAADNAHNCALGRAACRRRALALR